MADRDGTKARTRAHTHIHTYTSSGVVEAGLNRSLCRRTQGRKCDDANQDSIFTAVMLTPVILSLKGETKIHLEQLAY